ncbi:MAG: short chain dehydrogenase [Rhodospirillaceae bacterium]|nr:short chain dehydrogenase [Rhodospirillaceae bacterium]|tara:strand:+ start:176 stop:949 length:774 start_codon:yes stop_codon:yes gene_type:complete
MVVPKTALVTGAGRRLGLAFAEALAADGWSVAFHVNSSADRAQQAVNAITGNGGTAVVIKADLSHSAQASALVDRAVAELGPLGLLINNAAIFEPDSVRNGDLATIEANLSINLVAPMLLTRSFAQQLPADACGQVVNILDQRVTNPTPHYMSYTAAKMALSAMTRTWATDLAPRIRVNGLAPGMALPNHGDDEAGMKFWTDGYPLRRGTSPEELCDALRYLLSAPAVTGQTLILDGGQNLGWLHPEGGYPLKPGTP